MARYVKVSTISCTACNIDQKPEHADVVDYVIAHLKKNIQQVLPEKPDLIVLPEVCDRPDGFNMEERCEYYDYRGDRVLNYLRKVASENNCYITYPAVVRIDGNFFNCCKMIDRLGEVIGIYKKNYPLIDENVDGKIFAGSEATIFDCDFGRVGALICFDMNFSEYRSRVKEQKPDMVVFPSNFHGSLQQNYFAFDTRSYLVSAIGFGNLHGSIISPVGERIAETTIYFNHVTMTLNMDYEVVHLDCNRDKIVAMKEKYGEKVKIHDPGDLGSVLVSSETEDFTVEQVLKEFEIITLDEYLEKSTEHRNQCVCG